MKTYNEKIEELNKEQEEINNDIEGCENCEKAVLICSFHDRHLQLVDAKIEQLNSDRAEAIDEVKKLIKDNYYIYEKTPKYCTLSKEDMEAVKENDVIIDFLIVAWNLNKENLKREESELE